MAVEGQGPGGGGGGQEPMVERCPTGIEGLDELIEGGLPKGRVVLLAGDCGTGKSIFSTQFLYNGAVNYNEPGILLSLEQTPVNLKKDALNMGFDLDALERQGKLVIIDASLSGLAFRKFNRKYTISPQEFSLDKVIALINESVQQIGAKRAVVDSFSALETVLEASSAKGGDIQEDLRKTIVGINYKLQNMNLTSLLIGDMIGGQISRYNIEQFMVDGVITLDYVTAGADAGRHLVIQKMRGTKHSENIHMIDIEQGKGVIVKG
ncbi:MAG: hypothetical protein GF416_04525 [Candidatus Altiarchaeales archaeon]|nr:hypothetical protein [Candidatus Altiarchaeales archaeon]MBD3416385.1 hypothetical protein [Candidatus Altiarchaeales archaeon]